jgi:hypothetical protein
VLPYEIVIPDPSPADAENVVTALETAAIFRSKGDGYEAMRWLRRAAESAGEAGDDERALALSRSVADLSEELDSEMTRVGVPMSHTLPISQASPPPPPPPLPPPSARSTASPAATNAGMRNAARVAIAPSKTEPGVFEVRLLADDEAPKAGSSEALVVLLDPLSTVLATARAVTS